MNFWPSNWFAPLALGAVLATACSASAQQTIQFSKPTENAEEKANSFMMEPSSKLQGRASQYNAPKPLFDLTPEDPVLPPPQLPPALSKSLKDDLNKRKYWTLMTPEEIIGRTTPEKILGLPDPTGDDERTPEERFLRNRHQAAAFSATNAAHRLDAARWRNEASPFALRDAREGGDEFSKPDARTELGSRKYFDRLVTAPGDSPFGGSQNADSAWSSAFAQPAPLPKPNLEQIAARERFRAMMEPSAPPEKPTTPTRFAPALTPASNPDLPAAPLFNPLGRSYAPLQSGISRPAGITPLPTLTGPNLPPTTPKKSLVDLPPWLSDGPQPFGSQTRRF